MPILVLFDLDLKSPGTQGLSLCKYLCVELHAIRHSINAF